MCKLENKEVQVGCFVVLIPPLEGLEEVLREVPFPLSLWRGLG